jgi:uncharacterized protein YhaN
MRLIDIDLERYGPFTGQHLVFRPEARLHVVYGANEAGKSCALAAITDLFFGIERQTRYDFLHEGKEMRLGATVIMADGTALKFRRRKNRPILTDPTDRPLPDDALAPYLGSLSREVFCRAFGLNAMALRESGEELRKSDGELGASLFAAASGLRGFQDLRVQVEHEADGIFAPRAGRDRRFYQALDRYEQARKAIRDLELRSSDWKQLNDAIVESARRLEEISDQRGKNAAEQARLLRLKRAAPIVRLIDDDEVKLAGFSTLPAASTDLAERLHGALDAVARTKSILAGAITAEEQLRREHTSLAVDDRLLGMTEEVQRLFAETGAYGDKRRDLPRVEAEVGNFSSTLNDLCIRIGLSGESELIASQPTDAAQALLRALMDEGRDLETEHASRRHEHEEARKTLARLEEERRGRGKFVDPGPAQEKFRTLALVLKKLEQRQSTAPMLRTEARSLDEAAARLLPPVPDFQRLAGAPLPSQETVARAQKTFDTIEQSIRRERERQETSHLTMVSIEERLKSLGATRPVPTQAELSAVRTHRETEWVKLRDTLSGENKHKTRADLAESISRFERFTAESDRLADEAILDAERVAIHSTETLRLEAERRIEAEAAARLTQCQQERQVAEAAWKETWKVADIVPLSPTEMRHWLTSVEDLLRRRQALAARQEEAAALDVEVETIRPALDALAHDLSIPAMPGLDLLLLASRIEERLIALSQTWDAARDLDARLRASEELLENIKKTESSVAARIADWRARWGAATPNLHLSAEAMPVEVGAALDAWKQVPFAVRERANRISRVAGMQRDIEAFAYDVKKLIAACAPDFVGTEPDAAVKALHNRLGAAQTTDTRRRDIENRLAAALTLRERADAKYLEAQQELARVAEEIGRSPSDDLDSLATQIAERAAVEIELGQRREQLANAADGHAESVLRDALAGFDPDVAEAELARLRLADEALDFQGKEAFAEKDRHERRLKELEQGIGSEMALHQRRCAEVELTEAARDYAVLKVASLLISTALERRRSSNQDPLMARAGLHFTTLTGGAFDGLVQEFDDDQTPHLAGRRPSGKTISVGDMSEGARDQLYLALRLAYLEEYAAKSPPAPFVGDDLFASFDEERVGYGLETLAAIGSTVQPILFTHHRHVAEIARQRLGAAVDIIEIGMAPHSEV